MLIPKNPSNHIRRIPPCSFFQNSFVKGMQIYRKCSKKKNYSYIFYGKTSKNIKKKAKATILTVGKPLMRRCFPLHGKGEPNRKQTGRQGEARIC